MLYKIIKNKSILYNFRAISSKLGFFSQFRSVIIALYVTAKHEAVQKKQLP